MTDQLLEVSHQLLQSLAAEIVEHHDTWTNDATVIYGGYGKEWQWANFIRAKWQDVCLKFQIELNRSEHDFLSPEQKRVIVSDFIDKGAGMIYEYQRVWMKLK